MGLPSTGSLLIWMQWPDRTGQSQDTGIPSVSSKGDSTDQKLGSPLDVFPSTLAGSWTASRVARTQTGTSTGSQLYNQQLNVPSHKSSPAIVAKQNFVFLFS